VIDSKHKMKSLARDSPVFRFLGMAIILAMLSQYPMIAGSEPASPPSKTGQTKCYDSTPIKEIWCAGTGQDADTFAGIPRPKPRFTDNGDASITDALTGLVWTKDAGGPDFGLCSAGGKTWQEVLDYVKCLNANTYLGRTDWRVPNIRELESLWDAGKTQNTLWPEDEGFTNVSNGSYWSSTTSPDERERYRAMSLSIVWGGIESGFKDGSFGGYGAWPVRGPQSGGAVQLPKTGQSKCYNTLGSEVPCAGTGQDGELQIGTAWPNPRFTDKGDGTVEDNLTGLIWTKDAKSPGASSCGFLQFMGWDSAFDYVKCLNAENYLGFNDWRLPNTKELQSLIDYSDDGLPAIPRNHPFLNFDFSHTVWSSTPLNFSYPGKDCVAVWMAAIWHCLIQSVLVDAGGRSVWPVRGGTPGLVQMVLTQGWNFISFDRLPSTKSISAVLNPILAHVKIIWGYDSAMGKWKKWTLGVASTLDAFSHRDGYWVYVDEDVNLEVSGTSLPNSSLVTLMSGWNLVGYLGTDKENIDTELYSIQGKWLAMWGWDAGNWKLHHSLLEALPPDIQPITDLWRQKAYWILIKKGLGNVDWAQ
jgi:hypothetical protein